MVDKQVILESVGPVQAILDAHDGVVNVLDTTDGIIMISLEGGCTGCSATPMTAMQIYYSLMKLEEVNDVIFVNGELLSESLLKSGDRIQIGKYSLIVTKTE